MADKRRSATKLSEAEIKDNSTVTDEDVQRARSWWKSHAPTQLRDLIDAKVKESGG